ncbi:hypothetical protein OLZ31_24220, partial [Enterobacter asburiae]|nr:hypothetical protein [Enterobacter asburiae]
GGKSQMTPCSFTSIGTACAGIVILLQKISDNYADTGGYSAIQLNVISRTSVMLLGGLCEW